MAQWFLNTCIFEEFLINWLPITKINFNLSEFRDKEGQPGDVTTAHMAHKNNVSEKSDRLIWNMFYAGLFR